MRELLAQLIAENHLPGSALSETEGLTTEQQEDNVTPWYIRVVVGIGAWFAALFFIGFLGVGGIIRNETSMFAVGFFFCVATSLASWLIGRSTFFSQLALAFGLAGQVLFVAGVGSSSRDLTITLGSAIVLEIILLFVFRDSVQRFLSVLAISGAWLWLIADHRIYSAVHFLVFALALTTVLLWENESFLAAHVPDDLYRPVGYGLAFSLWGILVLAFSFSAKTFPLTTWWISTVALISILLALEYFIVSGYANRASLIFWIALGTVIAIVPSIQTPGILATLLVLIVGFRRGNRVLSGLAIAYFIIFMIAYYYDLDIPLLNKSYVLLGSGIVLLILRFAFLRVFQTQEAV